MQPRHRRQDRQAGAGRLTQQRAAHEAALSIRRGGGMSKKLTEEIPMQSMTKRQAALLVVVANILKKGIDPKSQDARTLAEAIDYVAFELSALGIEAPGIAARPSTPKAKKKRT